MTPSNPLLDRLRAALRSLKLLPMEMKLLGGTVFVINRKPCIGVRENRLLVRIDPIAHALLLEQDGVMPIDFSDNRVEGFVMVDARVLQTDAQLDFWVQIALKSTR